MPKATKEQIDAWKKKYGKIYQLTAEDSICYIRKPDRKILGHATSVAGDEPIKFNEIILNDCWLAGDESMREDDAKFFGISEKLAEIIDKAETEIKEL